MKIINNDYLCKVLLNCILQLTKILIFLFFTDNSAMTEDSPKCNITENKFEFNLYPNTEKLNLNSNISNIILTTIFLSLEINIYAK
jgi:hypothetical protein